MNLIAPQFVLEQVAKAVPSDCHGNLIVIGSLAAGFHFFGGDGSLQVRTKDIDCVISPRLEAIEASKTVAERLLANGWEQRTEGGRGLAGTGATRVEDLPVIRLYPPGSRAWFIELLTVPASEFEEGRGWTRVQLGTGHWGLPSYQFLSIATYKPISTRFGISYAQPRMMALANLLEHPQIKPDLMSSLFEGRAIKRSNKDLGRVLAIARLSSDQEIAAWPTAWQEALEETFPAQWRAFASRAGEGLSALLASVHDLDEALHTCNTGLLVSKQQTPEQFRALGNRLFQDAVQPLVAIGIV